MKARSALERGTHEMGIDLPVEASDKLMAYIELLGKWNATYNLTAIREPLAMVTHHLLDSLSVLPHVMNAPNLADVGAGAGLPGVPLAIMAPGLAVTLNESNGKKAAFLRQAAMELGLRNVQVAEGRVEAWRPAQGFAIVISRAFADLARFLGACRHLVRSDGALFAMKGAYPHAELEALPAGCSCASVIPLRVPLLDEQRHLVICRCEGPSDG